MARLILSEQDVVNAVCVYIAQKKQVRPEEVIVELIYDDDHGGFSAETYVNGRQQILITPNLIEAIRLYLGEYLNEDPHSGIELVLDDDEGIMAKIR